MKIKINKITIRKDLFLRNNYDRDAIERYKELYQSGKTKPILVSKINNEYILVDGFHRLKILTKLNEKFIDCKVENIPEDKLRERAIEENLKHGVKLSKDERNNCIKNLRIRDNKKEREIGKIFSLSQNRISEILKSLKVSETDTFQVFIIKEYFNNPNQKQIEIAKKVGCTISTVSKVLKYIPKLIQGDCLKELDNIQNNSIDLIYVDPPYFILKKQKAEWDSFETKKDYWDFTKKWLDKLIPKLKDTGRLFISFSQEKMWELKNVMEQHELIFSNCIVWNYRNNIKPYNKKQFKYTWEPIFFYRGKKAKKLNMGDGDWSENSDVDVWTISMPQTNYNKDKKEHPTQKPKELLRKIIKHCSNEKDLILDCFAGSGTTGLIARELKRNCILIEKDKKYIKLIQERFENAIG